MFLKMPCWYYDKKDLRNTPSFRDGIELEIESRYRREGARFIIDCGTKLGLRYDSCATGVVFFHRFYMFHSFKEFNRYVTAACCLFLAGKTEETPKKCKDLIKVTKEKLTDAQFLVFGDDPKEEVMMMERVLLQTIKFDLMVEHPYAFLLKFAKLIKSKAAEADKVKIQKMVQMAWTFINDSMCTSLCLQWEPEVVAVSLMYLASRLTKTEVTDWQGKPLGYKKKWFEFLVEDVNLELLEDVCHQVLDLYSSEKKDKEDTPPPPPPPPPPKTSLPHPSQPTHTATKRPRSPTPVDSQRSHSGGSSSKHRDDKRPPSSPKDRSSKHSMSRSSSNGSGKSSRHTGSNTPVPAQPGANPPTPYSKSNPYMPQQMYSASFMTQEGSQSIQSLVGGKSQAPPTYPTYPQQTAAPTTVTSTTYAAPPPGFPQQQPQQPAYQQTQPAGYQQPYTQSGQTSYSQSTTTYSSQYTYPPPSHYPQGSQYPAATNTSYSQAYPQPPPQTQQPAPPQPQPQTPQKPQQPQPPSSYPAGTQQYSQYPGYNAQTYPNYQATQNYQPPAHQPPPTPPPAAGRGKSSNLATVRISGR